MNALQTFTSNYTQPVICRICTGRTCSEMKNGRLINDNEGQSGNIDQSSIDTAKIGMSIVKIEDCEIRLSSNKEIR